MRRALRIAAWAAGAFALLLVVVVGALWIFANTAAGRSEIEKLTLRLTGGSVYIAGLAGTIPHRPTLETLELRDSRGVWLRAKKIEVYWSPLVYLAGRLQVNRLQAAGVEMERLPQASTPQGAATAGGGEVSIPHIDVAHASIDLLQLGPELAGVPASLVLDGSARLHSLRDMQIDASARRIDSDGVYELHLHFDEHRMDASLKVHEPGGGPLENILSLPGLGALQATVNLNGPRAAERLDISLQAGELKGHAEGSLNFSELSADIDFAIDAAAMAPRPDLAWDRAVLRGRWQGSVKAPRANGHLEINHLKIPGGAQFKSLNADVAADLGNAELHAMIMGIRVPGKRPDLLEDDPVKIDATVRLDDPARRVNMTASHRLFSLRGQAVTAGKHSAAVEVRLPNVAPFAALAGLDMRGSASVNAQVDGYLDAVHLKLDADSVLEPGTEVWAGAVGDRPKLQFSGTIKDGALNVEEMKFSGRAITFSASGSLGRQAIQGRWAAALPDLSAVSAALAGTLTATGSLDGPTTALVAEARLSSTLSVRGSPSETLSAELKLRGLPSAPSGTLNAQGSLDGAPLQLDIAIERGAARSMHATIHQAHWKSARANGDLTVASDAPAQGQLAVGVAQLKDLQHLLGVDIAGSLSGNIDLRAEGGRTHAHLELDAKDVVLAGFAGGARVTGNGFTDAFTFDIAAQVPQLHGAAANLTADGNLNLDAKQVSIASAHGSYRGQEIHLLAPARISFADGLAVDQLKLAAQKAELDVEGQVSPTLAVRASLRQVPAALVNVFIPYFLQEGMIEAHAELSGQVAAPVGKISLKGSGLRMADSAALGLPPAELSVTADLHGQTADIDARLDGGAASQLSAAGRIPIASDGTVDLKVAGKFNVGLFNPFLEGRGQHASGEVDIDATVAGSVAAPEIGGTLNLVKGSVNDYRIGITLSDITAQIVGNQGALQIKSFSASAAPGTISMSGTIGVLQRGIPVDLKISAHNAQPIVSKLITANLDADLQVKGTSRERLDISGSMHLNRTLIGIPNSLPPDVVVLNVHRRGQKTAAVSQRPLIIGLDVAVKAPSEILVKGRGLDAEMGGDLKISGTTSTPAVTGGFDLQRGSFSVASNRLDFTAGRVSFNGAGLQNKIDPSLDFTAETSIGATTVKMHITGYADAPVFDFTSTPAMPKDQILAQLLFGQSIDQLSGLQVAQIGFALASLGGVGGDGGLNPLSRLEKSLGLDRLTVGTGTTNAAGESSGASIEAGRYISRRVYLGAKQTSSGTGQIQVDVNLTQGLKLRTRFGNGTASAQGTTPENDPGSSIGLLYQFEY
jgi:translocation and assembly module TamB